MKSALLTDHETYFRENFRSRPYVVAGKPYEEYQPAYRYGIDARERYQNRTWDQVEADIERGWDKAKGVSKMAWQEAKAAVKDAWHHVERAMPGDADLDGR